MNKWWITGGIALLTGLAAFAAIRWHARAETPPLATLSDVTQLARRLDLSADQVKAIAALQSQYGATLDTCCAQHCAARLQLGGLMFKPEADPARLKALVEEMARAQLQSDLATLEQMRRIHALLTPDQQRRYEQQVGACVCAAACPRGSDHCAEGKKTASSESHRHSP